MLPTQMICSIALKKSDVYETQWTIKMKLTQLSRIILKWTVVLLGLHLEPLASLGETAEVTSLFGKVSQLKAASVMVGQQLIL